MSQVDLLVKTDVPGALDESIRIYGAALVGGGMLGGYARVGDAYVVRCFSRVCFICHEIDSWDYGEVIKVCDGSYCEEVG